MPPPTAWIRRAIANWSRANSGITTMGKPLATPSIVVAKPPCVIMALAWCITCSWGHQRST